MGTLDHTIQFLQNHSLRAILLAPRLKRPPEKQFPITTDVTAIRDHVSRGGNIGILGGEVMILDFDNMELANQMFWQIRALQPTVTTGSGKIHCYCRPADVPPRIRWNDQLVGEIQKGPNQYVVAPPSIHPNGQPYEWRISDFSESIQTLPEEWVQYLTSEMTPEVPEWLKEYTNQGKPEEEVWDGPPPDVLLEKARQMPKSKKRRYGVKFRCPACAEEGHDKSHDNAIVFNNGRWACAYAPGDPAHKLAIGKALGFATQSLFEEDELDIVERLLG